jgi:4-amino-4-deoxy-L-arabinose transferase-like glycosyltransferase
MMHEQSEQRILERDKSGVKTIHITLLIAILIGATLLRVHALGKTSYWYDEICSVLYARGETEAIFTPPEGYFERAPAIASAAGTRSWREVWSGFDTTPPLYPTLLRIWWIFFGQSDISGRALSVVLSVATIAVLFDLGCSIVKPANALWACALCAVSPPMVRYAQEARAYALLCLLGVLICDVALRIKRSGGSPGKYFSLLILCAAALLTHHFIAGALAGLGCFAAISLRGRARAIVIGVIAAAFIVEAWELPLFLHHAHQLHLANDVQIESRDGLIARTLYRLGWLPLVFLILPLDSKTSAFAIVLLILPFFLLKRYPNLLLTSLWSIGMLLLVAASDLWLGHGALGFVRYTLAAAPMVFINFAAIADVGGRWARHTLPAVTVVGALLAMPEIYSDQTWIKPETRELAADILRQVKPGDVLVIASRPNLRLTGAKIEYLGLDFYAGPMPFAAAILESPPDDVMRRAIWSHKNVWLIKCFDMSSKSQDADPGSYLGTCSLTPAGSTHLFAGRLFRAEQLPGGEH